MPLRRFDIAGEVVKLIRETSILLEIIVGA
jgi:hypothetical protein